MKGQLVDAFNMNNSSVQYNKSLDSGFYYIKVFNKEGSYQKKIIICD